jgi:hypothetical protein
LNRGKKRAASWGERPAWVVIILLHFGLKLPGVEPPGLLLGLHLQCGHKHCQYDDEFLHWEYLLD